MSSVGDVGGGASRYCCATAEHCLSPRFPAESHAQGLQGLDQACHRQMLGKIQVAARVWSPYFLQLPWNFLPSWGWEESCVFKPHILVALPSWKEMLPTLLWKVKVKLSPGSGRGGGGECRERGLPVLVAQEWVAQGQTRSGALQIHTTSSSAPASPWFPGQALYSPRWSPGLNTPGPLRDFPGLKFMALITGLSSSSEKLSDVGKIFFHFKRT